MREDEQELRQWERGGGRGQVAFTVGMGGAGDN